MEALMKNYKCTLSLLAFVFICLPPLLVIAADPPGEPAAGEEKQFVASVGEDGVQRVEVIGGGYYFAPNHIVVQVNKPVELLVRKESGFVPHDIVVKAPEAGIDFKVELMDTFQPIDFTPTKTGKYAMYCDKALFWFDTHRDKGMEGVIEVVE
jgi:plastocyanin